MRWCDGGISDGLFEINPIGVDLFSVGVVIL
jgi:hypothetical protein